MGIYHFCDSDLDDYEKTILLLAIKYGDDPVYELTKGDIFELSSFCKIDDALLEKALTDSQNKIWEGSQVVFGNHVIQISEDNVVERHIFFTIINIFLAYRLIGQILDKDNIETVRENVDKLQEIYNLFTFINSSLSTEECMRNGHFSAEYAIFDARGFSPYYSMDLLRNFAFSNDRSFISSISEAIVLCYALQYALLTRLNALYLIAVTQIIRYSPFFNCQVKDIAKELYFHLMLLLKNGRLISVQINSLHATNSCNIEMRTKKDNTTRLQIMYGYLNYDTYSLRLDFGHQGNPFVHYNNKSPGGIKACIFKSSEYADIIKRFPELSSCFVSYDDRWALKELVNCNLSPKAKLIYEQIRAQKEHDPAFASPFSEASISYFISLVAKMFPPFCFVPIDKEEIYAQHCFNYDKIMGLIMLLCITNVSAKKESPKVIARIVEKACRCGIIKESDCEDMRSIEGVCLIALLAKDEVYPNF